MIGSKLQLRQKLPLLLTAVGSIGALVFVAVWWFANQQVFNQLLPASRALQDLESRSGQLLQDYYRYMLTPDIIDETGFDDSLLLLRQRLRGYQALIAGQTELEALTERIDYSIDILEQAGDDMLEARRINEQIFIRGEQIEDQIDAVFQRYQGEVSVSIGRAIEAQQWRELSQVYLPELRMIKSINQQFLKLLLEIREYQIQPSDEITAEIAALQEQITISNSMFELYVESEDNRSQISAEILAFFATLGAEVEGFTLARHRAEFALSRAEQAGIDLHEAIVAATAYTETRGWQGLQESLLFLGGVLLAMLIVSYLFVYLGLDRMLRPLAQLRHSIGRFAQGDLQQRVPITRADEIGELAESFNIMADRIEDNSLQEQALIGQLEIKNSELERFTYTVSHELKSPLVTIGGFLGHLHRDLAANDVDRINYDMGRISAAIEIMGHQLDDLLQLSRVGHAANPPTRFSIASLCYEVLQNLEGLIDARGAQVNIEANMPEVYADEARIREVVKNLLENGIKFVPENRSPRINISAEESGGRVRCCVQDNGPGIEPRFHDKVFGLFDRLDNSVPGTGIGLSLARRIIEAHGGSIWIDSRGDGQGSSFCFTLPTEQGA